MKILFLFLFTISTQITTAQSSEIAWLKGKWQGTGKQPTTNGYQEWNMDFTYLEGIDNLIISYPTLYCGGNWTLVKADSKSAEFVETITTGTDKCYNNLTVIVKRAGKKKLKISFYEKGSNDLNASAVLRRKKV